MPLKSRDETFAVDTSVWNRRALFPRRGGEKKNGQIGINHSGFSLTNIQTVNRSERMRLPGLRFTLRFNEAGSWMGSINMVARRMWVRTKRIHFIGPSVRGGSCFEGLSPADLFWEGGGWPQRRRNARGFVFFHCFTYENPEIRAVCQTSPSIQSQRTAAEDCPSHKTAITFEIQLHFYLFLFSEMKEKICVSRFDVFPVLCSQSTFLLPPSSSSPFLLSAPV